jgi:hypothetical protein
MRGIVTIWWIELDACKFSGAQGMSLFAIVHWTKDNNINNLLFQLC